MGQQQLLLVILVTIIVGIATVVAINVFGTAAEEANRDAVRQDLLAAAAQAQGVWARPEALNGAAQSFSAGPLSQGQILQRLGIPTSETTVVNDAVTEVINDNGTYSIAAVDVASLTLTGIPSSGDATNQLQVRVDRCDGGNWQIDIGSPAAGDPCA